MRTLICAIMMAASLTSFGCSEDGKKSEPKISDPSKIDPRLKPAEAGGGAAPGQGKNQAGGLKGE